jgi:hypothetical protein
MSGPVSQTNATWSVTDLSNIAVHIFPLLIAFGAFVWATIKLIQAIILRRGRSMSGPVTAHDVATIIRQQNWKNGGCLCIDHDEAVALIEQYAAVAAAESACHATQKAFDKAIETVSSTMALPADRVA